MTLPSDHHDQENPSPSGHPVAGTAPGGTSRVTTWLVVLALVGGGLLGGGGVYFAVRPPHAPAAYQPEEALSPPRKKKLLYRCPMHPAITSEKPGSCPICGMTLLLDRETPDDSAAAAGGASGSGATASSAGTPPQANVAGLAAVTIDPERQQMIGLRTTRAARAQVTAAWRTVGRVEVDPTRVRRVNVKVEGYVDRVFVDFVGKPVRKGQPLITMYSPSLLAAQEEYLLAMRTQRQLIGGGGMMAASGDDLVAASRRKLELWDVPPAAIERLNKTGAATKTLTLVSPISGVVTAKNVVEGGALRPGDTPYEITDLRMVWVMADAYEADLARVRVGTKATLTLAAYPNRVFEGQVQFIAPLMEASSRTVKVHVHFANPKGELKPEMFGEVVFQGVPRMALRIPADAVIRTGAKDVVFLALGAGKFAPREVQLGTRDGEFVEITAGLSPGDEVVTRANFLVDSESRLRASLSALAGK